MFSFSPLKITVGCVLLLVLISSCSPSSQSERYNKPVPKESNTGDNSVRFTSKDGKKESVLSTYDVGVMDSSEFDDPPVEDNPVDTKAFLEQNDHIKALSTALTEREKILVEIISYLDTPYKYGGTSRNGIDCSGFTRTVFRRALGVDLPRTAREQFRLGDKVGSQTDLKFGDLVFFNTSRRSYPGHVGIYIGENMFAHASRSLGVTISSLTSSYYSRRYICGRRID